MAIEKYTNDYVVSCGANINNSSTSLSVSGGSPIASGFRILCGTELMAVTAGGTGTTWTVTRGIESTAAASHSSGDPIHIVLTAGALDNIKLLWSPKTYVSLTDGSTINWDLALGSNAGVTLGGNRTLAAPTNLVPGPFSILVTQDGTGSRTLSWNSAFYFQTGLPPSLSTSAGFTDLFNFVSDGTTLWNVSYNLGLAVQPTAPSFNNLVAWWKADALSLSNGNSVSSWTDSSGNSKPATQSTGGLQPVYHTNLINGLPAVTFTSSGDSGMTSTASLASVPYTLVVVYRTTNTSGNHRTVQGSNNYLIGPYSGAYQAYNGNFITGGSVVSNQWNTHMVVAAAGPTISYYINNVLVSSNGSSTVPGTVNLGGTGAFNEPFDGDIAEVCIYNRALVAGERSLLANYINGKYGI